MRKKVITILMAFLIMLHIIVQVDPQVAEASTNRITISAFALELAKEIGIVVEGSSATDILMNHGIIKSGDFTDDSKNLTRGDMLILLSRADDYLNHSTIDDKLIQEVIDKRISDINKVSKSKREDIAKGFIKGLLKGYSNGVYSGDRNLKLTKNVTKDGAIANLKLLKDKSLRAKISPDGQLIRTTNLPKNAKLFPYILASYPNKYYEWQLMYQRSTMYDKDGKLHKMINLTDYASPADIDKLNVDAYDDFSFIRKKNLNKWVEKAEEYLKLVFSTDYRSIGEDWINEMMKLCYQYDTIDDNFYRTKLNQYVDRMKANKTIVEYDKFAVDSSSLYYSDNHFYMRIYVKFRVKSSLDDITINSDKFFGMSPFDKILFSTGFVMLDGLKLNKWKEGYFDLEFIDYSDSGNLGVNSVWFDMGKRLD